MAKKGVKFDFAKQFTDNRVERIDPKACPKEAFVHGIEEPAIVVLTITFTGRMENDRYVADARLLPSPVDSSAALKKLGDRLNVLKAFAMEVVDAVPPVEGSRIELQYMPIRAEDLPECQFLLDWGAGRRKEYEQQCARLARVSEEQGRWDRAPTQRVVHQMVEPKMSWCDKLPLVGRMFRLINVALNTKTEVKREERPPRPVFSETPIEVPDIDPWLGVAMDLERSPRLLQVAVAMRAMFSVLVTEKPGNAAALRRAGFEAHRTVVGSGPLDRALFGRANNTIVADVPALAHTSSKPVPEAPKPARPHDASEVPNLATAPLTGMRQRPVPISKASK